MFPGFRCFFWIGAYPWAGPELLPLHRGRLPSTVRSRRQICCVTWRRTGRQELSGRCGWKESRGQTSWRCSTLHVVLVARFWFFIFPSVDFAVLDRDLSPALWAEVRSEHDTKKATHSARSGPGTQKSIRRTTALCLCRFDPQSVDMIRRTSSAETVRRAASSRHRRLMSNSSQLLLATATTCDFPRAGNPILTSNHLNPTMKPTADSRKR